MDDGGEGPTAWTRDGLFRRSVTAAAAVDLLTDPALEADLVGLVESLGITTGAARTLAEGSLLSLNGEEHRQVRAEVARAFTPRAVETARPRATEVAGRLADELADRGRADVVAEFAVPYVADVTGFHTGLDPADVALAWPAVMAVAHASKDLNRRAEEFAAALRSLAELSEQILARPRTEGDDTAVALLVRAVAAGDIAPSVAVALVATIFSAGHEPTINQLAIAVGILAEHPAVWEGLATGATPAPVVVEEVLRLRSTNVAATRKVACPVAHHGAELRAGELVVVGLDDANHDPSRFTDPTRFDITRSTGAAFAFGFGPHHCLGAALARLQLQEGLLALARRITCPTVVEGVEEASTGLRGPTSLVIEYQARRGG